MRRLTALTNKIAPFPGEIQNKFFKMVKVLNLLPGEWIPDDLPTGTFIFVEEGFLLLTSYQDNRWKCTNVYLEGTLAGTFSEGAAEMQEGSLRVRATKPSRIYYLTPEDMQEVETIFPGYRLAHTVLRWRSFMKNQQRARLFDVPPKDRIIFLDICSPILLRGPLQDLAEFLGLKTEVEKMVLQAVQSERLSQKSQLSQKYN
jgi:hypothetical protein